MATHVIQRGRGSAQVADTYISSSDPDTNYGDTDTIIVGGAGSSRALLDFALPAAVHPDEVASAVLRLYVLSSSGAGTLTVSRFLRSTWREDQATWHVFATGRTWSEAGCNGLNTDYTDFIQVSTGAGSSSNFWEVDVTPLVVVAAALDYRRALLRIHSSSQLSFQAAASSESVTQEQRPALIIETFSGTPSIATMRRRLITYGLV